MTPPPDVVVIGSVNEDHRIPVENLPSPGATVRGGAVERLAGGKGANQAVALARLGRSVGFVGAAGTDTAGDRLLAALAAEGINTSHVRRVAGPSGRAVVLVDPHAENCIVISPGANAHVDAAAAQRSSNWLNTAKVVVAQLEIPVETVLEAARRTSGTFILNPAPVAELPPELWQHVDVVVPNRGELAQLCTAEIPESAVEVEKLARQLPCRRVVVTLGSHGALVVDGPQSRLVPAPLVDAVDTTGAGDCFTGALADALASGHRLVEAATFATHVAAVSVRRIGGQAAMPTRGELDTISLTDLHP
ncbi:ribokinase [Streptomyces sp. NPDC002851]